MDYREAIEIVEQLESGKIPTVTEETALAIIDQYNYNGGALSTFAITKLNEPFNQDPKSKWNVKWERYLNRYRIVHARKGRLSFVNDERAGDEYD